MKRARTWFLNYTLLQLYCNPQYASGQSYSDMNCVQLGVDSEGFKTDQLNNPVFAESNCSHLEHHVLLSGLENEEQCNYKKINYVGASKILVIILVSYYY